MKKNCIPLLFALAVIAACDLETVPTDRYTVDSFWDTESGAEAAMTGCYNALTGSWLFGDAAPLMEETCTPNAYNYNNSGSWNTLAIGAHTSATEGVIKGRWSDAYRGIGRVNTQLNRLPGAAVSDGRKRTMEGEAKFLRALFYYMLVQYYTGVPLILEEPAYSQASLPRADRQDVIDAIIYDLDDAAALLDWQWASASDQGRATKGAALALKARVLLFEASPLMNPESDPAKWQAAADAAKAVIDGAESAGYGLFPDYRALFLPENEHNKEVIFNVEFSKVQNTPSNNYTVYCIQYRNNAPLLDLVNTYETVDGSARVAGKYDKLDPRFYASIYYPGCTFLGAANSSAASVSAFTGFACKKMSIYDNQARLSGDARLGEGEMNYIFLRYADILLMYAEALNEVLSAPDSKVYDALNAVRGRAGMGNVPAGKTKDQMREIIRHERRVEFAFEGLYYNDIRRWKTIETQMNAVIKNYAGEDIAIRSFDPGRDYWWPVPETERLLNKNLQQNPKY